MQKLAMRTGTKLLEKGVNIAKFGLNLFSSKHEPDELEDEDAPAAPEQEE